MRFADTLERRSLRIREVDGVICVSTRKTEQQVKEEKLNHLFQMLSSDGMP